MFEELFAQLTTAQWIVLAVSAFLIGMSKTGIPGVSIMVVPLMAIVQAGKLSVGLVLPMLIFADLFAAKHYGKHAHWKHIVALMPWTLGGIVAGYLIMDRINDNQLKPIIGVIVLIMLGLRLWQKSTTKAGKDIHVPVNKAFAAALGFAVGLTTMMANAAGPVMIIYLLAANLPKNEFIGTGAWFFLIINWVKVPFFMDQSMITADSLKLNLTVAPLIAAGAIAGIFTLKYIPQKLFDKLIPILAAIAAIKLLF